MAIAKRQTSSSAQLHTVGDDLQRIESLPLPRLRALWSEWWGEPPAYRSRDQLHRAMAYRIQAEQEGDLSGRVRRELAELASRFSTDRGFTPGPSINLKPGSTLIREWGGKRHVIEVVGDRFHYEGTQYSSLSQVAKAITGTKWNGPVFFGVKARKSPALQGRAA